MRKTTVVAVVAAAVVFGAAGAVRLVALPALQRIPTDLDTTVHLTGTADLVEAGALSSGDLAKAVRPAVPVTVQERINTVSTSGDIAVMDDVSTMTGPDQATVSVTKHTWSVDRATLAAAPPSGAAASRGEDPHEGLVVGFPLSPQPHDYPYWDTSTRTTVTAHYQRTEQHGNRDTYVYDVHASGPLTDAAVLSSLPGTLSKDALIALAPSLPAAQRDLLVSVSDLLPAQIPLAYKVTSDTTFWIDTATGYVVDVHRKQTVAAGAPPSFGDMSLPTQFSVELHYTDASITEAHDGAVQAQRGVLLLGTVTPLALAGLGLLILVIFGLWSLRPAARRARHVSAGE